MMAVVDNSRKSDDGTGRKQNHLNEGNQRLRGEDITKPMLDVQNRKGDARHREARVSREE